MNKCPDCGGQIVAEYIGSYGDVYIIGKNGVPLKRRLKRFIYESNGDKPMIYCINCGKGIEQCGTEVTGDA